ncbi:MAG: tetratricopeptide repeat protein [Myxococcales bacterium]|nr:tetratricopeptide repeat protein [Myxococcales bacterium]
MSTRPPLSAFAGRPLLFATLLAAPLVAGACGGRQRPDASLEPGAQSPPAQSPPEGSVATPQAVGSGAESTAAQAAASRARAALDAGRCDEAVARFERAITLATEAGEFTEPLRHDRAVALAACGRLAAAIDEAGVLAAGDESAEKLLLASLLVRAGLYDLALPVLDELGGMPATEAERADAAVLLAVASAATGDPEAARDVLERALRDSPADARLLNDLGVVREQLGDVDGALDAYNRALAADPEALEPRRNLAVLLAALGRTDDAARELESYLLRAPTDSADRGAMQGRLDRWRREQ